MKRFALAVVSIGISGFAASAFAAPQSHFVSPQKLDAIHVGESASEVIAMLGQPEFKPRWPNGTYSLAYETPNDENFAHAQLYVDIDAASGKVVGYSVVDDQ